MTAMAADLAADTHARASEVPGRYHIALPTHWDYLLPSGGVVMTCALRAAEAHLGDAGLRLASATTIFASPVHPGDLIADVHVIRRGGTTAQVRVMLDHATRIANGDGAVEVVATFARDRQGPDVTCMAMPAWAKLLAESAAFETNVEANPSARFRFNHQFDIRIADGESHGWPSVAGSVPRFAMWMRYRVPQRDSHGNFDRLALPPMIDIMPAALHRAIGSNSYRFYAPSLDLTTYFVDDTRCEWLLIAVSLRRARAGLAVADAEVWDDEGRFIAYGAQAMYVRGVSGEPPTVDLAVR